MLAAAGADEEYVHRCRSLESVRGLSLRRTSPRRGSMYHRIIRPQTGKRA
jgi:hypothetical protein